MARQSFLHFTPRDKPKKRPGVHKKSMHKDEKRQMKLTRYKGQGRQIMAKTVATVALQTGAVKPTSSNQTTASKATSLIESIVANPTMPTGTTISPQLQNVATMN